VRAALPLIQAADNLYKCRARPCPKRAHLPACLTGRAALCRAPPQRLQTAVVPVSIKAQEPADVDRPSPQESRGRRAPQRPPLLARLTREWRAHWRAAFASNSFPLQIGPSASSLRIRVRRFDSSRGHLGCCPGRKRRDELEHVVGALVCAVGTAGRSISFFWPAPYWSSKNWSERSVSVPSPNSCRVSFLNCPLSVRAPSSVVATDLFETCQTRAT